MQALTKELIFSQLDSTEAFPINFDEAWAWLGYSSKGHGKRGLLRAGLVENEDYQLTRTGKVLPNGGSGFIEQICLTVDGLKAWAMTAPTDTGKEVRKYYLEVEKEWKALLQKHDEPTVIIEPNWLQARTNGQSVHIMFQANCLRNNVSAKAVHDFITLLITGHRASTARELPLVGTDPDIGLDHHPSTEHQMTIANIKLAFAGLTRRQNESYKDMVHRAVFISCPN